MHKKILREQQGLRLRVLSPPKQLTRLLGAGLLLLGGLGAQAQTTTVFNETFEGTTNSFTLVNGSVVNQWAVGKAGGNGPTTTGTNAAYISNDAGVTNAYTITSSSVVHMYRDVTVPAGQGNIQLAFDWKAAGESTYDYILVQVAPTSFTPVAGTTLSTSGVTVLAQINLQTAFGRTTLQLPGSLSGSTQRLIFTWRNDGTGGAQPPATIDNITVTSQTANPLSGAYTINNALATGGTNFASFTDAATRLNQDGISGPVTFTVSGGPYTEQFLLGEIAGVSATNTIVVNGGGRTIRFASANTNQRAVVQLNGTDYTTINNLNIDATGGTGTSGTYGYGVLLTNAADNDRISNNTINADIATTSTNFAGIVVSGSTSSATTSGNSANNLLIEGNTVNGGYYGISLYGNSTTSLNTGNTVRNNNVRDFYTYGIYTGYQDGAQFIGNDISRLLRTNPSSFYGLYTFGSSRSLAIEKNRLHDPFTGNPTSASTLYGIYLANSTGATAATTNDVVNNVLYNINGTSTQYLIYNSGSAFSHIYNNSINADDQSAVVFTTYGIYNSGANTEVKNNVVSITRPSTGTKYGLYYSTAPTSSDYNDIYVPNGNVGYFSAALLTLADLQAANGKVFDANSISTDPAFAGASTGNLLPTNVLLNNAGTPLARVTQDITGAARGTVPDLGAYEFTPVGIDVAPVALLGPATGTSCYSAAEAVVVQIRNAGTATLNFATNPATATVVVTLPGGLTQTLTGTVSTGTLASGALLSVTLNNTLNLSVPGAYTFAVTATVTGDANTANNVLTPAATRTVVAPVAGVLSPAAFNICGSGTASLSLAGASSGSLQYQSSSSATGTFTDIAGATAATYTTPVLSSTTYYRVRSTCNANTAYSNVAAITVNNPVISAAPTPLSTCAGGTATLAATVPAGISVRYFTAATGGTAVGTGSPFVTPALTANTTYYAEAFAGGTENVGKALTNGADGTNTGGGLYFTTTGPTTIATVTVYRTANAAAGTATIYLLSGSTTSTTGSLATIIAPVPANTTAAVSPTVLTLNFAVPAAGSYTLYLSSATPALVRDYTTAVPATAYPYTSPSGTVSITGATLATYYYFFYNWQIGSECVGTAARTPIVVNVGSAGLVASLPAASAGTCGRTPYQLAGTIAGTATGATYTSTGTGTFSPNASTLNATYTPSAADVTAGSVTITLTPTGPAASCTTTGQVVLAIASAPAATFSYPSGTYCSGSASTVAATLATGTTAGTFSTTGTGLGLNTTTGAINLAASTAGTYTVTNTAAAAGACAGTTATATITIVAGLATPTLTATPQAGGGVLLSAPALAGATYQFSRNGNLVGTAGTSNTLLLPAGSPNGNYTVVITSTSGCASAPSTALAVVVTAAQTASLAGVSLRVYPNPTPNGSLTLELRGPRATASQLLVLNSLGQVVHTSTIAPGSASLNLAHLASGVYTFRVKTTEGVLTQRVVRE
ncbi:hypothetical protein GCM10028824_32200 [Hymenobacter segetis]|uniref:T9SS type A sorting domain-containing protein n=1 Tax=Hymenobacter segetis TaxID=2025509 RepID=A0ABU9LP15_9BACT